MHNILRVGRTSKKINYYATRKSTNNIDIGNIVNIFKHSNW